MSILFNLGLEVACDMFLSVPLVLGTCLPTFGAKQGEMCERDSDCESGLICSGSDIKTCTPVTESKKQYGKFPTTISALPS